MAMRQRASSQIEYCTRRAQPTVKLNDSDGFHVSALFWSGIGMRMVIGSHLIENLRTREHRPEDARVEHEEQDQAS